MPLIQPATGADAEFLAVFQDAAFAFFPHGIHYRRA
jgi:hypothetical protein